MNNIEKLKKAYLPMTETAFYILLSLGVPRHGYGIVKFVAELTRSRIKLGSGTVYGTLTKMQKDGVIAVYDDSGKRTLYEMTAEGRQLLDAEIERIKQLYADAVIMERELKAAGGERR